MGKDPIDWQVDPQPYLLIEIDVTSDRIKQYFVGWALPTDHF
jgi:Uma2 family endonuclease